MAIAIFSAGAPASGNGLTTEDQLNDLVLAEQSFKLAMADSADIFGTSAIEMQNGSDAGSLVGRNRILSLGWSISMDATAAEDTDVAASSVTAAASDVTIARRALRLDETGLANAVGGAWGFSPIPLGLTMAGSFSAGRMGLFATAIAGASTNVTSAGAGSIDDLYDIIDSFTTSTGDPGMLVAPCVPRWARRRGERTCRRSWPRALRCCWVCSSSPAPRSPTRPASTKTPLWRPVR
jgi:hypothetical protein